MEKTTKTALTVAIVGVGAYLLYKNLPKKNYTGSRGTFVHNREKFMQYTGLEKPHSVQQREKFMQFTAKNSPNSVHRRMKHYAGSEEQGVVGKRLRADGSKRGITDPYEIQVHSSRWGNAEGKFYDVQSSGWVRG